MNKPNERGKGITRCSEMALKSSADMLYLDIF
jgi:hypothetical protein